MKASHEGWGATNRPIASVVQTIAEVAATSERYRVSLALSPRKRWLRLPVLSITPNAVLRTGRRALLVVPSNAARLNIQDE